MEVKTAFYLIQQQISCKWMVLCKAYFFFNSNIFRSSVMVLPQITRWALLLCWLLLCCYCNNCHGGLSVTQFPLSEMFWNLWNVVIVLCTRCQTESSQYGRNTSGVKMATLCLSGRCEVNIIRIQKVVTSLKFDIFLW